MEKSEENIFMGRIPPMQSFGCCSWTEMRVNHFVNWYPSAYLNNKSGCLLACKFACLIGVNFTELTCSVQLS